VEKMRNFKRYEFSERIGQNENTTSLLRQYFPKTMELVDVTMNRSLRLLTNSTADPGNVWDSKHLMRSLNNSPVWISKK
jgi:hypothetical protein